MAFIIEVSTQGEITTCTQNGESLIGSEFYQDMMDCTGSGDAEPACSFVRDHLKPEFRIVAKNADGGYENRLAIPEEKAACCSEIYFESDTDFTDEDTAELYLIWQAACDLEHEKNG